MNCPVCSHDESRVLRTTGDRRERECARCRHRWRTLEMPAEIAVKLTEAAHAARALAAILPEG
jgi:transcriptional regulator NrdR family protein